MQGRLAVDGDREVGDHVGAVRRRDRRSGPAARPGPATWSAPGREAGGASRGLSRRFELGEVARRSRGRPRPRWAPRKTRRRGSPPSSASEVARRLSARTLASFHRRAPSAVWASPHSAARTPATLLAAIEAPVPGPAADDPLLGRPSATSRAAPRWPTPSRRARSRSAPRAGSARDRACGAPRPPPRRSRPARRLPQRLARPTA